MTDGERTLAFEAEKRRQLNRIVRQYESTAKDIGRLLDNAALKASAALAELPSDYQAWRLPHLRQELTRLKRELGQALAQSAGAGTGAAFAMGKDMLDAPLAAGGVRIAAILPELDLAPLLASRNFQTERMRDISSAAVRAANNEIGLVMVGIQSPGEAVSKVAKHISSRRGRALTVVRTEMGRAFSTATQERFAQASTILPGLKKEWRKSGKVHSRSAHDAADGQTVDVDKAFFVGGELLMFPRDPSGSPKNTINCACSSLPLMENWEVRAQ
jgi:hypothetical protein